MNQILYFFYFLFTERVHKRNFETSCIYIFYFSVWIELFDLFTVNFWKYLDLSHVLSIVLRELKFSILGEEILESVMILLWWLVLVQWRNLKCSGDRILFVAERFQQFCKVELQIWIKQTFLLLLQSLISCSSYLYCEFALGLKRKRAIPIILFQLHIEFHILFADVKLGWLSFKNIRMLWNVSNRRIIAINWTIQVFSIQYFLKYVLADF